jgi:hypothetical protein
VGLGVGGGGRGSSSFRATQVNKVLRYGVLRYEEMYYSIIYQHSVILTCASENV